MDPLDIPLFYGDSGIRAARRWLSLQNVLRDLSRSTDAEARAPGRAVLRQMTPEHILQVLETGVMKTQAAERSRPQRRILAEYLSEKKFGSAPPDIIPRSAFCSNAAASRSNTTSGGEWNGWG